MTEDKRLEHEDKRLEEIREHLKNGRYSERYVFDCEDEIRDLLSVIDRLKGELTDQIAESHRQQLRARSNYDALQDQIGINTDLEAENKE